MSGDTNAIAVGATSKIGIYICKYPAIIAFAIILGMELFSLTRGESEAFLFRALVWQGGFYAIILLILFIMSNKWCYRIIIDKGANNITFYRIFNRQKSSFALDNIKINIGAYCHVIVDGSDFIIHVTYIHDLVSHLPQGTTIEYKGSLGRFKEKDWQRRNKTLIPGE